MTPQELKNSILQLAIQGKLVEQRAEEGTGRELLEKILAAKNAEGAKGKGEKSHAKSAKSAKVWSCVSREEIPDDEKPFDIPESWEWVRLIDCGEFISGFTPSPKDLCGKGIIPYFKVADMNVIGNELWMQEAKLFLKSTSPKKYFFKNTIVYPKNGGAVFTNKKRILAQDSVVDLNTGGFSASRLIDLQYIYVYFTTIDFRKCYKGTALPTIDMDKLKRRLLPLPPLAEQKRIVAKVEELMPLVERYEKAWSKLKDFNKRFPADMQKSLLQMAIQGKLVEQRAEEGTARELLEEILAAKNAEGAKGRGEKSRAKSAKSAKAGSHVSREEIPDDEKPFDIPKSWEWVRLGEVGIYKKGPFGSALTKSMFVPKGANTVKVYEQKNAIQKDATLGEYYIRRDYFETKMSGFEVHPGDVIVSCAGTIGETYVLPEGIEQGIINQALMRMKIFAPMYIPYFLVFFDVVLKQNARANSKGSAIKNIPPFEILKNYIVPLPPLAEQKRIVAKLEELLSLCDRLK